ncbi:MAG: FGGY-family carbohydrate kinase, partial [Desulfobacterales bacterium]|nr:FGGY-family carbohydrate kinase [Desulfobacterales bacterium]
MNPPSLVVAYDIGTTSAKTCLFRLGDTLELLETRVVGYPLLTTADGGAEQRADDWWAALCEGTREVLALAKTPPDQVAGISFCCQMQALILVDDTGTPVRNPMGYMDGRAAGLFRNEFTSGFPRIEGMNARKLLTSLYITGGAAATAKDPLWKYRWVQKEEPEAFARAATWLDVRDYLALRCTGNTAMTRDSAHLTFIYDTRPGKEGWSNRLCRMFDVDTAHLPKVQSGLERAGTLTGKAAEELGLAKGTPVFGGGGDITLIPIGSGCTKLWDTHIYVGTSGWVVANADRRMVDLKNFLASISGALPGTYNYVGEQETSGLCLQWVRDHLALDEIGVYLSEDEGAVSCDDDRLYDLMNRKVAEVPAGAGGVIFTPWLQGNRAPREDPCARGMFFNIGLNTGKRALIRSVLEGIAFHKRWILEAAERKMPKRQTLRFVGGGAKSAVLCQIMADITGRRIEVPEDPQNVGAAGAAIICGLGLGRISDTGVAGGFIRIGAVYEPDPENRVVYDRMFRVFKGLYDRNKTL